MNKIKTDEKLDKKAKETDSILYSTKIFDSNNHEKPTLILRELELDDNKKTVATQLTFSTISFTFIIFLPFKY